jgi:hypothetical protein
MNMSVREMGQGDNSGETTETNEVGGSTAELRTDGALALALEVETDDKPVTREQRRSRRKRAVRARTISVKRMTKRELEIGRMMFPESEEMERPRTRAECAEGMRPCPYVSCKHHLFLDVSSRTGAIKLNFPDIDVENMTESCALDVSDRGGTTLEEVGAIMNLTRERIRQLEVKALAKLVALDDMESLRDFVDEGPVGKRRLPVINARPVVEEVEEEVDEDEDEDEEETDEVAADAEEGAAFELAELALDRFRVAPTRRAEIEGRYWEVAAPPSLRRGAGRSESRLMKSSTDGTKRKKAASEGALFRFVVSSGLLTSDERSEVVCLGPLEDGSSR